MDTRLGREGMNWISIGIYVCIYASLSTHVVLACSGNMLYSTESSPQSSVDPEWDDWEGGAIYIHIADSLHCTAETKTTW